MAYVARKIALHVLTIGVLAGGCAQVINIDHEYVEEGEVTTSSTSSGASASSGGSSSTTSSSTSTSTSASSAASSTSGLPGECPPSFECVPGITMGSYVRLSGDQVDACPTGWTEIAKVNDGNDPGCSACSCSPPGMNGTCDSLHLHQWDDMSCDSSITAELDADPDDCVDLATAANAYEVFEPDILGGECQPSGGQKIPIAYERLCELQGSANPQCANGGGECVPAGSLSSSGVCNAISVDSTCTAGYGDKGLIYTDYTDNRICDCACEGGGSCGGAQITLYSGDNCDGGALATIPTDTNCKDTSGLGESSFKYNAGIWTQEPCIDHPITGGSVSFNNPLRLCCQN